MRVSSKKRVHRASQRRQSDRHKEQHQLENSEFSTAVERRISGKSGIDDYFPSGAAGASLRRKKREGMKTDGKADGGDRYNLGTDSMTKGSEFSGVVPHSAGYTSDHYSSGVDGSDGKDGAGTGGEGGNYSESDFGSDGMYPHSKSVSFAVEYKGQTNPGARRLDKEISDDDERARYNSDFGSDRDSKE